MKKIRVTWSITVDIEPYGFDDDEAEKQCAMEMVCDEPVAYVNGENVTVECEVVEVPD